MKNFLVQKTAYLKLVVFAEIIQKEEEVTVYNKNTEQKIKNQGFIPLSHITLTL